MSGATAGPAHRFGTSTTPWIFAVAAAAALAAAILIGGNASGRPALAVGVALVQAAFVVGWMRAYSGTVDAAVLAVAAIAVADLVLLRTRSATGGSIAGVIGLSVIAVLFHQLVRRDPRGVTRAVALTLAAIMLGVAPALLLPLRELPPGRSTAFVALLASGVALVVARVVPGPDPVGRLGGLAAGTVVAVVCGLGRGGLTTGHAVAVGAGCTVVVLLADRLLSRLAVLAWSGAVVAALVPLALACPVAYLVGRVIAPAVG